MKTATAVLLAVVLALALAACGWEGSGTVTEKTHHEGYYYTVTQCGAYNAKGTCTVWIPVQHYMPESWEYKVTDAKGETHDVSTSREDWEAHKVGDHFDNR